MNLESVLNNYQNYLATLLKGTNIRASESMLIQLPLYYSDEDMITFRLAPLNGGWVITDDCNTWETLNMLGVPVESEEFKKCWKQLTQTPNAIDSSPHELRAMGTEEQIPELIHDLALTAIRSEALILQHQAATRSLKYALEVNKRFSTRFEVLAGEKRTPFTQITRQVTLPSERIAHVAAHCISSASEVKNLVVSALNGTTKDAKRSSFQTAVSTLSFLSEDFNKVAVLKGKEKDWDSGFVRDLESLQTKLFFAHNDQQIDSLAEKLLAA